MRRAADALVETLKAQGVDRAFCVPGESYLSVIDALHDHRDIHLVPCRHESGAGFMAVADAKLTGRAGTCFVSRGPGATNASIAVHTAMQDAVPMVLFVGQIERKDIGKGAFQEVDYRRFFAPLAKSVEEVSDAARLPEIAARAYHVAESGTPGPAIVSLPEDMLEDACAAPAPPRRPAAAPGPSEADLDAITGRLRAASRPVIVAGGLLDPAPARHALAAAAEAWQVPVVTTFKHQDLYDNDKPLFAGHLGYGIPPALAAALREADFVLAVGTRLGDITTQGYTLPSPDQPLAHVYPDPDVPDRVFAAERAVIADPAKTLAALAARNAPPAPAGRADWAARLHGIHVKLASAPIAAAEDGIDFGEIIAGLIRCVPDDAVIAMDAGNFSSWLHKHFSFKSSHRMLGAVTGAMGLGVPAAVAAALREPNRMALSLIGDGGFLMTGNELATAVRERAPVKLIVSNNASYGTIRTHQERHFSGRPYVTDLVNPDFAALAEAFGARGFTIRKGDDARAIVAEALALPGPALIDVHASLDNVSAYTSIPKLRAAASNAAAAE